MSYEAYEVVAPCKVNVSKTYLPSKTNDGGQIVIKAEAFWDGTLVATVSDSYDTPLKEEFVGYLLRKQTRVGYLSTHAVYVYSDSGHAYSLSDFVHNAVVDSERQAEPMEKVFANRPPVVTERWDVETGERLADEVQS